MQNLTAHAATIRIRVDGDARSIINIAFFNKGANQSHEAIKGTKIYILRLQMHSLYVFL